MARKTYTGPILDISFDKEICIHAAECVRGMPEVYDTSKRPWVNPEVANTSDLAAKLREVTLRCPSGALRIERDALAERTVTVE